MKIQHHRIDTNVVVGLLIREFRCSGIDVSAKVLAMYAGTRTSPMEPQWLAAGLSQIEDKKLHGILLENQPKISFAVSRDNKILLSILNNTLKPMQPTMLTNALSIYENSMRKVTTADYLKDNLKEVLVIAFLLAVFISVILILLQRSKIAEAAGSGLGMAIVRKLVDKMGVASQLKVNSEKEVNLH